MELRDAVNSQFQKCHRLAKKYYDQGDAARARVEYLKCGQLLEQLAKLSPQEKRGEILNRSQKFRDIAEGLQQGTIKVYTDGIVRVEQEAPGVAEKKRKKEKTKSLILAEKPRVRFVDIAGLETVKENIKEAIVYPFKYPEEYKYFGVKPGGGILLYGPPGCGKTMLAAAAAAECDAVFISLKVSDIKDKYVGESEKNIKEVFDIARSYDKAILFFDEIDSLAGERSATREGHERSLVSELLAQMNGLEAQDTVRRYLFLAATNRPWDTDLAFRRPPRVDMLVFVPHPDSEARKRILELNLKGKPLSVSVNLEDLARRTEGYASAEIVAICQMAAKIPLRERIKERKPRRQLTMADFEQVFTSQKTMLSSWYAKAAKELVGSDQTNIFGELIEAAKEHHELQTRSPS
ncbi:MAG: ATP-binding protein [Dehalococcoidia bacterium]